MSENAALHQPATALTPTQIVSVPVPDPAPEWAPTVDANLARVGTRIALIANLFFFASWYFAFFYLRAVNNNGYWMKNVDHPPFSIGVAVAAMAVAAAAVYLVGNRAAGPGPALRIWSAVAALLLGLAAAALMAYQLWNLGFDVTQGGYPSVFTGLATAWMLEVCAAMFWLGTIAVQAWRGGDTLTRPGSSAQFGYILVFLAGIGVIDFVILYIV